MQLKLLLWWRKSGMSSSLEHTVTWSISPLSSACVNGSNYLGLTYGTLTYSCSFHTIEHQQNMEVDTWMLCLVQQVLRYDKDSYIPSGSATCGRGIISLPFHLAFASNPAIDQLTKLQVTPTRVHVQLPGKVGFINTLLELPGCCCCCLIDRILWNGTSAHGDYG